MNKRKAVSRLSHGLHLALILSLSYFSVAALQRRNNLTALYQSINGSMESALPQMEEEQALLFEALDKNTTFYQSEYNVAAFERAERSSRICDSALTSLTSETPDFSGLDRRSRALADSLLALVDPEDPVSEQVRDCLLSTAPSNSRSTLFPPSAFDLPLARNDLKTRIAQTRLRLLYYFLKQTSGEGWGYLFEPALQQSVICPAAGAGVDFTAALISYRPVLTPGKARVWVNGEENPVRLGISRFTVQFDQPGLQPLQVRIKWKDRERDTTFHVLEKTYQVNVR